MRIDLFQCALVTQENSPHVAGGGMDGAFFGDLLDATDKVVGVELPPVAIAGMPFGALLEMEGVHQSGRVNVPALYQKPHHAPVRVLPEHGLVGHDPIELELFKTLVVENKLRGSQLGNTHSERACGSCCAGSGRSRSSHRRSRCRGRRCCRRRGRCCRGGSGCHYRRSRRRGGTDWFRRTPTSKDESAHQSAQTDNC